MIRNGAVGGTLPWKKPKDSNNQKNGLSEVVLISNSYRRKRPPAGGFLLVQKVTKDTPGGGAKGDPPGTQQSGSRWDRRSSEMSERWVPKETAARDMELATT